MFDLIVKNGRIVDPVNKKDFVGDIAVESGKIVAVGHELEGSARRVVNASNRLVIPGIIDMHTHMRTVMGHPHAQRMIAMAGVTTTLDMAGPLDNILDTIDIAGAGVNIAILDGIFTGLTIKTNRPDKVEQRALMERTLEHGGIGLKLMGGHIPMDLDICEEFIELAHDQNAWIAWHAGNAKHGSNILGMRDAIDCAHGRFLHVAHINSYCRAQVRDEISEALEAIEMLKANPHIFSESYVSDLNGTALEVKADGNLLSKVTETCLKKKGFEPTREGLRQAIAKGACGVLRDNGMIGELLYGDAGVAHWESVKTVAKGSFSVNPAASRFLVAKAKRDDGSFVVDAFSTDGGTYPRNVIVEVGLSLVKFGAITLDEYVLKASVNGAKALGLSQKGHLSVGADADITVIDFERQKAYATVVGGNVIMENGVLCGKGTTIICDERGADYLAKRSIPYVVKSPLDASSVSKRLVI